jgi:uncharacterized membrane protein
LESKRTKKEIEELERIFLNRDKKKAIEALSSIVFGIALSIGTFIFVTSDTQLVLGNIITFAFSFFILIYIWLRYTKILELIKVETNLEMILNIIMLFLVVIEPYLFNQVQVNAILLATASRLGYTSFLFGLDIAALMFVLAAIYMLGLRGYKEIRKSIISHYDYIRNGILIIGAIFVVADLPFFWNVYLFGIQLRFVLWGISAVIAVVLRNLGK